jgi:phage terminase large subunit
VQTLQVEVPAKLGPLLQPKRYKGAHGGRGGAKSHFFGQMAVLRNYADPLRGVCIREVQNSIKDSVKSLIEGKIASLGLSKFYEVTRDEVRGANGSLMVFRGMQDYNADNIKSLEGFDWAWVEEAQSLSARSWRLLRPTIRKPGSEIWCSWNPRWDTDAVDSFFRGANCPDDAVCVEINWRDNPWLPDVLKAEIARDFAADPEMAEHVWNGGYEIVSEGAYYAKMIAAAEREGRVGDFPYDPKLPVKTSWDLGVDDYTAVWFVQEDGHRATVIDYYEVSGDGASQILATCMPEVFLPPPWEEEFKGWTREGALAQLGRDVPYHYGEHFFPHDLKMREWGAGARSRVETVKALGLSNVRKGAAVGPEERINASRRVLPLTRFNNTARVQLGLKRLRRYSRKMNDALGTYTTPLHDENSHGADAFGEFAVNCRIRVEAPQSAPPKTHHYLEAQPDGSIRSNMTVREIIEARKRKRDAD